jgi:hypothetical protein
LLLEFVQRYVAENALAAGSTLTGRPFCRANVAQVAWAAGVEGAAGGHIDLVWYVAFQAYWRLLYIWIDQRNG